MRSRSVRRPIHKTVPRRAMKQEAPIRGIGENQREILKRLVAHGYWYSEGYGARWNWTSASDTKRLLDSLVDRKLVFTTKEMSTRGVELNVYRPTLLGIRELRS